MKGVRRRIFGVVRESTKVTGFSRNYEERRLGTVRGEIGTVGGAPFGIYGVDL